MDTTSTGSPASVHDWPWMNTSLSPDERAALLLAQLTLEEKVGMVHGKSNDAYYMEPVSRLGIPALTMTDGPSGINEGQATALPAPIGLAATWDLAAAEQYGELVGREAEATGHNVFLGACLDIARVPVYGRMFEALGEDPILTGQMAVRSIQSVQRRHIVATAKHYNENPHLLTEIFRQQVGFTGWVMSDFEATHSTVEAANAGLDQEMPSAKYFGN